MHVHLNRWRKNAEQFAAARSKDMEKAGTGKATGSSSSGVSDLTGTDFTYSPPQTNSATPPPRSDKASQGKYTAASIVCLLDNTHLL